MDDVLTRRPLRGRVSLQLLSLMLVFAGPLSPASGFISQIMYSNRYTGNRHEGSASRVLLSDMLTSGAMSARSIVVSSSGAVDDTQTSVNIAAAAAANGLQTSGLRRLLDVVDIIEFSSKLKLLAAKRRRIQGDDRLAIVAAIMDRLDLLDDELFSNCVWAMGILRCTMEDLDNNNAYLSVSMASIAVQQFWSKVNQVSVSSDRVSLTRLAIGLSKMGVRWVDIPKDTQKSLLLLLKPSGGASHNVFPLRNSRELATVLFTLGQLGVSKSMLPDGALPNVLGVIAEFCQSEGSMRGITQTSVTEEGAMYDDEEEAVDEGRGPTDPIVAGFTPAFTSQSMANAFNGLARMGVSWTEDVPAEAQEVLITRSISLAHDMRPDELCSLLQSMALMKVPWMSIPQSQRAGLLAGLEGVVFNLSGRELSNAFWSLGKLNVDYDTEITDHLRDQLLTLLTDSVGRMKLFDLESVFVGLGLMRVDFRSLPVETQEALLDGVGRSLSKMNIFCLYNTIWGLARMGVTEADMGTDMTASVVQRTLSMLHTFLPEQYGDVVWSMATMGVNKQHFTPVMCDRLLAVLSRVYAKMHVRAAAYTLWGLNKMGFVWGDFRASAWSFTGGREAPPLGVTGGREAPPLGVSVSKYLRQRVASMREHDYSVLLYSLGGLGARLLAGTSDPDFPDAVVEKVHHRMTRVGSFMTSRSLANGLYGLSQCGVGWGDVPELSRDAWIQALHGLSLIPKEASSVSDNANAVAGAGSGTVDVADDLKAPPAKGLVGMNGIEFSQVMHSLGAMRVAWSSLAETTRHLILHDIVQRHAAGEFGNIRELCTCLWGLSSMGCPYEDISPALVPLMKNSLWSDEAIDSSNSNSNSNSNSHSNEGAIEMGMDTMVDDGRMHLHDNVWMALEAMSKWDLALTGEENTAVGKQLEWLLETERDWAIKMDDYQRRRNSNLAQIVSDLGIQLTAQSRTKLRM